LPPFIGANPLKLEVDKCPLIAEDHLVLMKTSDVLALVGIFSIKGVQMYG